MEMIELNKAKHYHMIGIGGIGVSAIARILLAKGFIVSGSDVRESTITQALRKEGALVYIGHRKENLEGADMVVYSTAIPDTNPELVWAKERKIPVVHRSHILSALMAEKRSIGVTGTNGKGTVSALIAYLLDKAGLYPSFAIGGILLNYNTNARLSSGNFMVCELDESDGSFTNTKPNCLVINNLEADHLNYYKDLDGLIKTFETYLSTCPTKVFGSGDDPNLAKVFKASSTPPITYGESSASIYKLRSYTSEGLRSYFEIVGPKGDLGGFILNLPGYYNAMNALGAISVLLEEGIDVEIIRQHLPSFKGLENRFTIIPRKKYTVVKDYISHPTGIRSVLRAVRGFAKGRVIAVFKPYRFTMINYLKEEYSVAFFDADITIITETYPAGEVEIPGVNSEMLVKGILARNCDARLINDMDAIPKALLEIVREDDIIVFFGGEDLFHIADLFMEMTP